MGMWGSIKAYCLPFHLVIGFVFVVSGCLVCFLMLLAYLTVWRWDQKLYRKIVCNLAYLHWCQFTFLGQWWAGSECSLIMENPDDFKYVGKEHFVALMNHKYDVDWLMAWILSERLAMLGTTKIYGKSSLRMVPLIGWAWTFTESIFLKRDWDKDKEIISRDLKYVTAYPEDYWVTLLLFCEGTRFTESKRIISMEVARKKGMHELKHHLLPRTKGFVHSMHGLKGKVPAIYDLTIGVRGDGAAPTLMNIVQGQGVKAEIYCRRIPLDSVPTDTDEECAEWLHQLFINKDKVYQHFVDNGRYKIGQKFALPKRPNDLVVWSIWMLLLGVPFIKYMLQIISYGSATLQLAVVLVLVVLSIGVRQMIAMSEIEKGSIYGKIDQETNGVATDHAKHE